MRIQSIAQILSLILSFTAFTTLTSGCAKNHKTPQKLPEETPEEKTARKKIEADKEAEEKKAKSLNEQEKYHKAQSESSTKDEEAKAAEAEAAQAKANLEATDATKTPEQVEADKQKVANLEKLAAEKRAEAEQAAERASAAHEEVVKAMRAGLLAKKNAEQKAAQAKEEKEKADIAAAVKKAALAKEEAKKAEQAQAAATKRAQEKQAEAEAEVLRANNPDLTPAEKEEAQKNAATKTLEAEVAQAASDTATRAALISKANSDYAALDDLHKGLIAAGQKDIEPKINAALIMISDANSFYEANRDKITPKTENDFITPMKDMNDARKALLYLKSNYENALKLLDEAKVQGQTELESIDADQSGGLDELRAKADKVSAHFNTAKAQIDTFRKIHTDLGTATQHAKIAADKVNSLVLGVIETPSGAK